MSQFAAMQKHASSLALLLVPLGSANAGAPEIAYLGLNDGFWEVWTADAQGGDAHRVTDFRADVSKVSWHPDGAQLFVNRHDGRWFEVGSDGKDLHEITPPLPGIVDAVLSPDGGRVAFSLSTGGSIDDNDLWLYDLRSQQLRKLTQMPRLQHEPAWSPDGRYVYFLSGDGGQAHDIWRVDVASSATEQLTVNSLYHFDLALRADGALAFSSNRSGNYELWLHASPQPAVRLTDDPGLDARPDWSPDGTQVVFESTRDGDAAIYRMAIDSRDVTRLSAPKQAARAPVWAPREVSP